ncbi:uncharacterized protein LOC134531135 isoform X1 [Bacillus rossius redtenbacheri]|uniref:uncharacterized protein LOC134531135 isoform X1 n=1 Tax=Bacillus rossius redtenbacheri TaxID=93214 RepID=UPI002FDDF78A
MDFAFHRRPEEMETNQRNGNTCEDALRKCEEALGEIHGNRSGIKTSDAELKVAEHRDSEAEARLYLRRFVNILMDAANMKQEPMFQFSSKQFDVQILITPEQLSLLMKFANNEGSVPLRTLDEIFTSGLHQKSAWALDNVLQWLDYFCGCLSFVQVQRVGLILLVPLTAVFLMLKGYSFGAIVRRVLVMVFVAGFVLTYKRMHKAAEIRSYVYEKHGKIPEHCGLSENSWYHWLFSDSGQTLKECQQYYEAVWMDPGLQVSAEVVLSEMLAVFVLHPCDVAASTVVKFSSTILGGLPWGTNWLVLLLCLVALVALAVLACGALAGGRASFLGLQVHFHGKQSPVLPPQQAIVANSPPESGLQQSAVPPVFNIHINLSRRQSLGRQPGSAISGDQLSSAETGSKDYVAEVKAMEEPEENAQATLQTCSNDKLCSNQETSDQLRET